MPFKNGERVEMIVPIEAPKPKVTKFLSKKIIKKIIIKFVIKKLNSFHTMVLAYQLSVKISSVTKDTFDKK